MLYYDSVVVSGKLRFDESRIFVLPSSYLTIPNFTEINDIQSPCYYQSKFS